MRQCLERHIPDIGLWHDSAPALQHSASPPPRARLHGMGGTGKTALAAFPDGIFWLASTRGTAAKERPGTSVDTKNAQAQVCS